jgi:hypothetical protein
LLVIEPVKFFVAVFEVIEATLVGVTAEECALVTAGIPSETLQEGLEVVGRVGDVLHRRPLHEIRRHLHANLPPSLLELREQLIGYGAAAAGEQ